MPNIDPLEERFNKKFPKDLHDSEISEPKNKNILDFIQTILAEEILKDRMVQRRKFLNQKSNQHDQEVRRVLLEEMLEKCDEDENEGGRILIEYFKNI